MTIDAKSKNSFTWLDRSLSQKPLRTRNARKIWNRKTRIRLQGPPLPCPWTYSKQLRTHTVKWNYSINMRTWHKTVTVFFNKLLTSLKWKVAALQWKSGFSGKEPVQGEVFSKFYTIVSKVAVGIRSSNIWHSKTRRRLVRWSSSQIVVPTKLD